MRWDDPVAVSTQPSSADDDWFAVPDRPLRGPLAWRQWLCDHTRRFAGDLTSAAVIMQVFVRGREYRLRRASDARLAALDIRPPDVGIAFDDSRVANRGIAAEDTGRNFLITESHLEALSGLKFDRMATFTDEHGIVTFKGAPLDFVMLAAVEETDHSLFLQGYYERGLDQASPEARRAVVALIQSEVLRVERKGLGIAEYLALEPEYVALLEVVGCAEDVDMRMQPETIAVVRGQLRAATAVRGLCTLQQRVVEHRSAVWAVDELVDMLRQATADWTESLSTGPVGRIVHAAVTDVLTAGPSVVPALAALRQAHPSTYDQLRTLAVGSGVAERAANVSAALRAALGLGAAEGTLVNPPPGQNLSF